MDYDLYAEENEPKTAKWATVYKVATPRPSERKTDDNAWVYVRVDQYGVAEIERDYTRWFGEHLRAEPNDIELYREKHMLMREIFDWLVDWELCEWRSIGPEDGELFATEKLTDAK